MRTQTDIVSRIKESDKKVLDAATQIVEISAALRLTVAEFERAVDAAKKSAIMTTRNQV